MNETNAEAALTVQNVLDATVPAIGHTNADVKNAATKIILDVQRLSGEVKDHHFLMLPEKQQAAIKEKVFAVQCEKDLNQTKKRDFGSTRDNAGLAAMQQAVQPKVNIVNIGMEQSIERDPSIENLNEAQAAARAEIFERNKLIVIEKAHIKDW